MSKVEEDRVNIAHTVPSFGNVFLDRSLLLHLDETRLREYRETAELHLRRLNFAKVLMSGMALFVVSKTGRFLPGQAELIGFINDIDNILKQ